MHVNLKSLVIIMGTLIVCKKISPIHQVDFKIFQRISKNFDLLVALEENVRDHQGL